ncbi:MAG: DUF86 domain-containing protein [Deltaproteobacteria bacterium]|nr:DUF86 domain-containing protein [Deltaproteobacteria bacterium]
MAKKLAFIETCLRELREQARPSLLHEIRELRFVEHTLQIAIQSALDIASHIISDERLGEPKTNRSLFDLLANHAWVTTNQAEGLSRMAGFRNILVHGYTEVDPAIVRDVLENHLGDLDAFVAAIRAKLGPRT